MEEEMELHPGKRGKNGEPLLDGTDRGADQAILVVERYDDDHQFGVQSLYR